MIILSWILNIPLNIIGVIFCLEPLIFRFFSPYWCHYIFSEMKLHIFKNAHIVYYSCKFIFRTFQILNFFYVMSYWYNFVFWNMLFFNNFIFIIMLFSDFEKLFMQSIIDVILFLKPWQFRFWKLFVSELNRNLA